MVGQENNLHVQITEKKIIADERDLNPGRGASFIYLKKFILPKDSIVFRRDPL